MRRNDRGSSGSRNTLMCIACMTMLRGEKIESGQVSVFVGRNYVLTFQERCGDAFDPIRGRIRDGGPMIRSSGPGYLAYALLDAVIDGYYPLLETYGEKLDSLGNEIVGNPQRKTLQEIHQTKGDLLGLRPAIWPQREAINTLIRDENPLSPTPSASTCATAMTTVYRSWTFSRPTAKWPEVSWTSIYQASGIARTRS